MLVLSITVALVVVGFHLVFRSLPTSSRSPHAELLATLDEFYMLLDQLGMVDPGILRQPSGTTGRHAAEEINMTAARMAGYSDKAVDLMYQLTYLNDRDIEIMPSTYPASYLGADMDEIAFEGRREMLQEQLMPVSALSLTSTNIYGYILIYDVETELMTPWKPFDSPVDTYNYYHVPGQAPREVLGSWIENYRNLTYLATPMGTDFNSDFYSQSGGEAPKEWRSWEKDWFRASYNAWNAGRHLKTIYIECGWNINSKTQETFRKAEFLTKRERYWEDIVQPLEGKASQIHARAMSGISSA